LIVVASPFLKLLGYAWRWPLHLVSRYFKVPCVGVMQPSILRLHFGSTFSTQGRLTVSAAVPHTSSFWIHIFDLWPFNRLRFCYHFGAFLLLATRCGFQVVHTADHKVFNIRLLIVCRCLPFSVLMWMVVVRHVAAWCNVVARWTWLIVVDRGCFDLPETA
jgi:hypothetical protein